MPMALHVVGFILVHFSLLVDSEHTQYPNPWSFYKLTFATASQTGAMDESRTTYTSDKNCNHMEHTQTDRCHQLVLYQPAKIIPPFQESARQFSLAGKEWLITQQWNEIGVAAVVWEAAIVLSHYLESLEPSALAGRRAIELGAGTGLAGMVASALGASTVILTDRHTASAEANLAANRHNIPSSRDISVSRLEWGQDVSSFSPPFELVLAADVVYVEETFPLLIQSLGELSDVDTVILLSCKHRYERDDRFFELLHSSFDSEVLQSDDHDLKLYCVRKKPTN